LAYSVVSGGIGLNALFASRAARLAGDRSIIYISVSNADFPHSLQLPSWPLARQLRAGDYCGSCAADFLDFQARPLSIDEIVDLATPTIKYLKELTAFYANGFNLRTQDAVVESSHASR
jgi:hypothetical protein